MKRQMSWLRNNMHVYVCRHSIGMCRNTCKHIICMHMYIWVYIVIVKSWLILSPLLNWGLLQLVLYSSRSLGVFHGRLTKQGRPWMETAHYIRGESRWSKERERGWWGDLVNEGPGLLMTWVQSLETIQRQMERTDPTKLPSAHHMSAMEYVYTCLCMCVHAH